MSVVRLKEVAAAAGVSISTAAAALREEGVVKAATRAKVEAAARRLGYRKNTAAALMSSRRTRTNQKAAFAMWLTAYPGVHGAVPPWELAVRHARLAAEEAGLIFDHLNIGSASEARVVLRQVRARGCDGVVWGRCRLDGLPAFPWEEFCVVSTEQARAAEGFDVVRSNFFRNTVNLLVQLRSAGYERIGVCLREHTPRHPDDEARYGGTVAFLDLHVAPQNRIPPLVVHYRLGETTERIKEWVLQYKPDVVVGSNQEEYRDLLKAGFEIPRHFSYVALHVAAAQSGFIAGLQLNEELVPRVAIGALLEKMRHTHRGLSPHPRETLVNPPYLPGLSCPTPRPTPVKRRAAKG